jgi:hypothetical protein
MNEIYVNYNLIDKIRRIRGRTFDHTGVSAEWDISELYRRMLNLSEDELTVCVIAALQKCPSRVYQALAEDRDELLRKGKKDATN